ncbi:MAG: glycosyltransferase family 4 protein [Alphaproteobacteria bacterium]|nr:glycosyltransferase family 4 protein [Alphaproteobacteria bacterium]
MRSERPTILQIIPELDTGGAELSTIEISEAIAKAGGRSLVVSQGGRLAERVAETGGEFIPFAAATKNPLRIALNANKLAQLIRQEQVDLIHARSRAPAWSASLAAKHTKTAFVTTFHGAYHETNRLKRYYNSVMVAGDLVIANSNYTSQLVQNRYELPADKVRVIYRGLDGTQFDPETVTGARRNALLSKWLINDDTRIILVAARLSEIKGHRVVIEAAHQLLANGQLDNAVVIFAGDAQGREGYVHALNERIAHHDIGHHVRLVGHVTDIPAALSLAHVALITSVKPETFGRASIEAQAMTCPVIATGIGALPETLLTQPKVSRNERTGWLVPPGDAPTLADAIAEALALAPVDRVAQGERARNHVLKHFSLAAMRRKTLSVYDEILGSHLA